MEGAKTELSLRDVYFVFVKRWFYILAAALFAGGVVFSVTYWGITPKYAATAKLYMYSYQQETQETKLTNADITLSKTLVGTYIVILQSDTVLEKVIEELDLNMTPETMRKMISAASINDTEAFTITVTSADPALAREIVNTIADIAPEEVSRVVKAGSVEIIDYAKLPTSPASPNLRNNVLIGVILGLLVSFGGFLVYEIFDTVVRGDEDLETNFAIPILGDIPRLVESENAGVKEGKHGHKHRKA